MMKAIQKIKDARKNIQNNKGFTLVELIVVIVILAILIGVSVTGYSKYIGQSKINTDKNNAETIRAAIVNAQAEDGVYEKLLGDTVKGKSVLIVKMQNTGTTVEKGEVEVKELIDAVNKQIDTTSLKTQTKEGVITITATGTGDGAVTVSISATGSGAYDGLFTSGGSGSGSGSGGTTTPTTP